MFPLNYKFVRLSYFEKNAGNGADWRTDLIAAPREDRIINLRILVMHTNYFSFKTGIPDGLDWTNYSLYVRHLSTAVIQTYLNNMTNICSLLQNSWYIWDITSSNCQKCEISKILYNRGRQARFFVARLHQIGLDSVLLRNNTICMYNQQLIGLALRHCTPFIQISTIE